VRLKPCLTIHGGVILEAKWHGWLYYSHPMLRNQSLCYFSDDVCANKKCRCVMECRHHLKMISLAVERLILALRHDSVNSKMGNVQNQTETLEDHSLCVDTVPDCPLGSQMKRQETQRSGARQGGTEEAKGRLDPQEGCHPRRKYPPSEGLLRGIM